VNGRQPLRQYSALAATFGTVLGGFLLVARKRLPDRVPSSPARHGS
jgi:hypothetical protein